jgi:hypothetical protein
MQFNAKDGNYEIVVFAQSWTNTYQVTSIQKITPVLITPAPAVGSKNLKTAPPKNQNALNNQSQNKNNNGNKKN